MRPRDDPPGPTPLYGLVPSARLFDLPAELRAGVEVDSMPLVDSSRASGSGGVM